jgi:hypothetical protein
MRAATSLQNYKLRKPSRTCELMQDQQKRLEQLYLRRAKLIDLIHALEIYDRTVKVTIGQGSQVMVA